VRNAIAVSFTGNYAIADSFASSYTIAASVSNTLTGSYPLPERFANTIALDITNSDLDS